MVSPMVPHMKRPLGPRTASRFQSRGFLHEYWPNLDSRLLSYGQLRMPFVVYPIARANSLSFWANAVPAFLSRICALNLNEP
jgi:hypothetical protein